MGTIGTILHLILFIGAVCTEETILLKNVGATGNQCLRVNNQDVNANYMLLPCDPLDIYQQFRHSGIWKTEPGKETYIKNVGSDKCLCSSSNAFENNGAKIYQCRYREVNVPNQRWAANGSRNYDPTGKKSYWIRSTFSGKLLTVRKDANVLVVWEDEKIEDPRALWLVYAAEVVLLKNDATGTCIKVKDQNVRNDGKFVAAPCDPRDTFQQIEHSGIWVNDINEYSRLKVIGSKKCLCGNGGAIGTVEGFGMYQYDCNNKYSNQNFNLDNGKYNKSGETKFWVRVGRQKCLTFGVDGVDLVQGTCADKAEFYWRVYVAPPRAVLFKNVAFQLCMKVEGTNIVLRSCLPPAVQEFKYFRHSSIWEIDPKASANLSVYTRDGTREVCLSSAESNTVNRQDGYKIYTSPYQNGANFQQYRIGSGKYYPNGKDVFTIESVPSGKCLAAKSKTDFLAQLQCGKNTTFYWQASPLPFSQKLADRPDCIGPKTEKQICGSRLNDSSEASKFMCSGSYPECCWDDKVNFNDEADPACYKIRD